VEEPLITAPEEGQTSSFLSEVHDDCYLFDIHGIMHYEFAPKGETITQHSTQMFCSVHRKMSNENRPKIGALGISFSTTTVLPLTVLSAQQFLTTSCTTVPHLPY
jgi:hypothetical protein